MSDERLAVVDEMTDEERDRDVRVRREEIARGLSPRMRRYWQRAEHQVNLLIASRADQQKSLGSPKAVKHAVRMGVTATAVRLAIAEDVLASNQVYGSAMREEYERRCTELGVASFEG